MYNLFVYDPAKIERKFNEDNVHLYPNRLTLAKLFKNEEVLERVFDRSMMMLDKRLKKVGTDFYNIEIENYGFLEKPFKKTIRATNTAWLLKGIGYQPYTHFTFRMNKDVIQISYWSDKFQKTEHVKITASYAKATEEDAYVFL